MVRLIAALVCAGLFAPALSAEEKDGAQDLGKNLAIAFALPRAAAASVYQSRDLVVEAVYQATTLSGGVQRGEIVITGTLACGADRAQYSPGPADRLVVMLAGQTHEFVIKQARGNDQAATAAAWLSEPHELRYSHTLKGEAEADVSVQFDGTRFSAEVKGWSRQTGTRYDVHLKSSGRTTSEGDFHGQEAETRYTLGGTISGGGAEIEVVEAHTFTMASATSLRLPYSMRGSASRFNALIQSTLRAGEAVYVFQDVAVQTDTKTRGNQTETVLTRAEGTVLCNGERFGSVALDAGKAVLVTPDGSVLLDLPLPEKAPDRSVTPRG